VINAAAGALVLAARAAHREGLNVHILTLDAPGRPAPAQGEASEVDIDDPTSP